MFWKMTRYDVSRYHTDINQIVVDAQNCDVAFRVARRVHPEYSSAQPMTDREYEEYRGPYFVETPGGIGYKTKEKEC